MEKQTLTVHVKVDPARRAYVAWVDAKPGRVFNYQRFSLFAAGYYARVAEEEATAGQRDDDAEEQ